MTYSESFKTKCKSIYPNQKELCENLEKGKEAVGDFLENNCPDNLTFDEILNSTSLEELQKEARKRQEKRKLFDEWHQMYVEQYSSMGREKMN